LTGPKRLPYPALNGAPERQCCNLDRPPVVARRDACGAMARLIEQHNDRRLPARPTAGFLFEALSYDH
jgi:hypothetical protein